MAASTTASASEKAARLLSIPGEHRFRAENLPFGIDVWYRRLAGVTFATVFSALTREEGLAIVNYYQTRFNARKRLDKSQVPVLLELEARLDVLIRANFPAESGGAFMRLSDRSPKDADPLHRQEVWREYQGALEELRASQTAAEAAANETDDGNLKMQAIGKVNFLRVRNGAEAMSLLLTSERVFSDCHDWLEYGEPVMIAFRAFEPELTLENEFRAFIYKHRLTAISQYDHYTFYPRLSERKDHVGRLIYDEWRRIHQLVGEESYCIDFGYLPSRDQVRMIEISPFLPCTGPACFSWKDDVAIMQATAASSDVDDRSFEFRTVTTARKGMNHVIESNWDQRWLSTDPPYFTTYSSFIDELGQATPPVEVEESSFGSMLRSFFFGAGEQPAVRQPPLRRLTDADEWQRSGRDAYRQAFAKVVQPSDMNELLFVYGTLKNNFHWHAKFLFSARFLSAGRTVDPFPLVVGDCGVPYLLGDQPGAGHQIVGELYWVNSQLLSGMDDYEGVSKNYYERRSIDVVDVSSGQSVQAWVYLLPRSDDKLRQLPSIPEYTKEIHDERYLPIRHIQIKQQRYLGTLEEYSIQD